MTRKCSPRASALLTLSSRTILLTQVRKSFISKWRVNFDISSTETRAFRALSMSGLGKMKDAVKEIKFVLMKNMMNYTCWHIMGIIHRKEK